MKQKLTNLQSTPGIATTIRIIPTSEGLVFCALSPSPSAVVLRPGESLLITIEDQFQTIQHASIQSMYAQPSLASVHNIYLEKESTEPPDV